LENIIYGKIGLQDNEEGENPPSKIIKKDFGALEEMNFKFALILL
jgi:hypothetical protein